MGWTLSNWMNSIRSRIRQETEQKNSHLSEDIADIPVKQATALWVGYLAVGILLVLDLVICLQTSSVFAGAMFFTSVVLLACWALFITMLFPLVARCDNTIGALFKMGIAMALRNVMPVLAALMVTVAFFAVGVFVFWPVLLVAPGLASYCNAFLFNRIFDKYGMTLE